MSASDPDIGIGPYTGPNPPARPAAYTGPNRYAVNPSPRGGGWWHRNGKSVVIGGIVVSALAIGGAVVWTVIQAITGGAQTAACTSLQNQLTQLQAQQFAIYKQAGGQNGTFTPAQATAVQSLGAQISNVIGQMANVCLSSPGATLTNTLDKIIVYAGWAALIIVGLVTLGVSVTVIQWFRKRWGGSSSSPNNPPKSADDVDVSPEFNQSTMGTDTADGAVAGDYSSGAISQSDANTIATNLSANDPMAPLGEQIANFFRNLASTVSEALQVVYDALATLYDYIVSALSDLAFEFTIWLA